MLISERGASASLALVALLAGCGGAAAPTLTEFGPDDRCPAGGVEVATSEATTVLCNGADGTNGADGQDGAPSPIIHTLWATGLPAAPGGTVVVHVSATVAPDATAAYTWEPSAGWTVTSGQGTSDVTLTAPAAALASGTVTVRVGDGGESPEAVGVMTLNTAASDLPQIHAVSVTPQPVVTTAGLTVVASDAGGGGLTATWNIGGIDIAEGLTAEWTNPGIPGLYDGVVTVEDTDGNVTTSSFRLVVGSDSAWPAQGRTLQSTERMDVAAPAPDGTLAWTYPGPGMQNSAVLDSAGNIYVGSWDQGDGGFVASVTPAGTERWLRPMTVGTTSSSDVYGAPLIANGKVYWSAWDGNLYAANPTTGANTWAFFTGDYNDNSSPITAADGTTYVGSMEPPALFAVNPDGTEKWRFETDEQVQTDPAIAPDGTVIFIASGGLYAVSPDGVLRWRHDVDSNYYTNLAIGPTGTVYIVNGGGVEAYAIDGAPLWNIDLGSTPRGVSLGADETVYVVTGNGELAAIWRTGVERWRYSVGDTSAWTTPAIGPDGTIYFVTDDGTLHAVNADGTEKFAHTNVVAGGTSGQVAIGFDGRLFVGGEDGLCAIE